MFVLVQHTGLPPKTKANDAGKLPKTSGTVASNMSLWPVTSDKGSRTGQGNN